MGLVNRELPSYTIWDVAFAEADAFRGEDYAHTFGGSLTLQRPPVLSSRAGAGVAPIRRCCIPRRQEGRRLRVERRGVVANASSAHASAEGPGRLLAAGERVPTRDFLILRPFSLGRAKND